MRSSTYKTSGRIRDRKKKEFLYEMKVKKGTGYVAYQINEREVILNHTFIPKPYRFKGYGNKLAKKCIDHFTKKGYLVVPKCDFIQHFIDENPQYHYHVSRWK